MCALAKDDRLHLSSSPFIVVSQQVRLLTWRERACQSHRQRGGHRDEAEQYDVRGMRVAVRRESAQHCANRRNGNKSVGWSVGRWVGGSVGRSVGRLG